MNEVNPKPYNPERAANLFAHSMSNKSGPTGTPCSMRSGRRKESFEQRELTHQVCARRPAEAATLKEGILGDFVTDEGRLLG